MDQNNEQSRQQEHATPKNPGSTEKAQRPDPNLTDPSTLPTTADEAGTPLNETKFGDEHSINADHAEPVKVTGTSNDNYIEGEYIDVGGGD